MEWTSTLSGWAGEVRQKMQMHWEAQAEGGSDKVHLGQGKAEYLGELGGACKGLG